jgi:hypothetical protein
MLYRKIESFINELDEITQLIDSGVSINQVKTRIKSLKKVHISELENLKNDFEWNANYLTEKTKELRSKL